MSRPENIGLQISRVALYPLLSRRRFAGIGAAFTCCEHYHLMQIRRICNQLISRVNNLRPSTCTNGQHRSKHECESRCSFFPQLISTSRPKWSRCSSFASLRQRQESPRSISQHLLFFEFTGTRTWRLNEFFCGTLVEFFCFTARESAAPLRNDPPQGRGKKSWKFLGSRFARFGQSKWNSNTRIFLERQTGRGKCALTLFAAIGFGFGFSPHLALKL